MYEDYWGLTLPPFQNVPDPRLYFASAQHEEAISRLMYVIKGGKGAAMLTGEVGSGKTTVSWMLAKRLGHDCNIGVINNPALSPLDFLREVAYQLGVPDGGVKRPAKLSLLHAFNEFLYENNKAGRETVIIVDEAQIIKDVRIFEELRLLLNFHMDDRFLLTLVLMGQPELSGKIAKVPQLGQRIAARYHLGPLGPEETAGYVRTKLRAAGGRDGIFTDGALGEVYRVTGGIARDINNVADLALLAGFAEQSGEVTPALVQTAAMDGMARAGAI
ncbi:MAG: AAA family ATPase [Nitrospirae bacterium]|nr:AAA family ATPase [Nitrospirota bacterium]MBI5694933.1 AAA family ATPase [Nitrospirota bacterium]